MAPLRPCPCCSRHVRVSEPACPFCAGKLDDAFRSMPSPRVRAVGRLSRAALFALGASGLAACGGTGGGSGTGSDTRSVIAPYGGPPACDPDSGCEIVEVDASGLVGSAYGGTPPPVATLCGDPVCPPLPEDASADGSMADGAGGSDAAPIDAAVSDADGSSDAAASGDAPRD